ncbi:hypothetical protein DLAC_01141 [Tieghemostelium lacteum]|uniref:DUF885 family protein n=1 Tax=Tieghemostelium lacteum TaxID=361077 RepID=A0A152A7U1_TIELA|nr:hypothetical protein DLAC_01141 [Tieghemostelium lacteum]|eukprot:KYR02309.1 hypothetical protein DLAC_01141 [Tieghemostelium lacteum]
MTNHRVLEKLGISNYLRYNNHLDNVSPSFRHKQYNFFKKNIKYLESFRVKVEKHIRTKTANEDDFQKWVSMTTAQWTLESFLMGHKFNCYKFPLYNNLLLFPSNVYKGCITAYFNTLKNIQRLNSEKEITDYICRLEQTPSFIKGLLEDITTRSKAGIIPPVDCLIDICKQLESILHNQYLLDPNESIIQIVKKHLSTIKSRNISSKRKELIIENTKYAVYNCFIPPLRELLEFHYKLIPKSPKEVGIWRLPNGDETYKFLIYYNTSTTVHPMEIHELAFRELRSIQSKLIELAKPEFTYDPNNEFFGQFLRRIITAPELNNVGNSVRECVINKANESLSFSRKKICTFLPELKDLSNVRIGSSEFLYDTNFVYHQAPLDNSELPLMCINFNNELTHFQWVAKALSFREGVPGHHFQQSYQRTLKGVDVFRKNFSNYSFYAGWGHYACSVLAAEQGLYENKWELFGNYLVDLRATGKLILDPSMHYKSLKWDTDKCKYFLINTLGYDNITANHEIRFIATLPGTVLAEKFGQVRILDLRNHAKEQLGSKFNLIEFHKVILGNGSLPLDILSQVVQYWIEKQLNSRVSV